MPQSLETMNHIADERQEHDTHPTRVRYGVLVALCFAAALAYIPRNGISAAESSIRKEFELTKYDTRWIIVGFFVTYAAFQIPTGQLGHAWGTRKSLPLFSLFGSVMTAGFACAGGWASLLLSRLGMGTAQAGYFPCSVNTMAK